MAIPRAQEDSWTKEMAKWEHRPVMINGTYIQPISVADGGKGGAPFAEYPKAVYKAEAADGGPRICAMDRAHDEAHERQMLAQGWSVTQEQAIQRVHDQHVEFAKLAANRAYNERWMSEAAKAEAAKVDESTMQHVPVIPETPIKRRRGRPSKSETVS